MGSAALQQPTEAYKRWRMCERKRSYPTRSKANKRANKRNLRVYECPYCFCWHITKSPRGQDAKA